MKTNDAAARVPKRLSDDELRGVAEGFYCCLPMRDVSVEYSGKHDANCPIGILLAEAIARGAEEKETDEDLKLRADANCTCTEEFGCAVCVFLTEALRRGEARNRAIEDMRLAQRQLASAERRLAQLQTVAEEARDAISTLHDNALGRHEEDGHYFRDELLYRLNVATAASRALP